MGQRSTIKPTKLVPGSPAYLDASSFTPPAVGRLVRNPTVKPHWTGEKEYFWYRRDTKTGHEFILVDPNSATSAVAFDHRLVAAALCEAAGYQVNTDSLPIEDLEFSADLSTVIITTSACRLSLNRRNHDATPLPSKNETLGLLVSPDGKLGAFCRDNDIWLRELKTDLEHPLTTDGIDYFGYGKIPDSNMLSLHVSQAGITAPPYGAVWSPDSRWLVVQKLDERRIAPYPFLISTPKDGPRPKLIQLRRPLLGDEPVYPRVEHFAIDVASGKCHSLYLPESFDVVFGVGKCWWDKDANTLFTTVQDATYRHAALLAIDLRTGASRIVVDEQVQTHHDYNLDPYRAPNVCVLNDGKEVVWYSQRDGWAHLYLYDAATGALIRRLTQGDWVVFDLIRVDEENRAVYFTAGRREPGRNPYYRHLYRVSLDGGDPVLLTPENADHAFRVGSRPQEFIYFFPFQPAPTVSPDNRFFLDTYSTVTAPPVTKLRSTADGAVVMTLEVADPSALEKLNYTPPVPFIEKADDGVTDIHGLIYFPPDFDPAQRYAVIDALVVSPQQRVLQHQYVAALWDWHPPGALALSRLGFIVVEIEGRGSTHRDKAFHDFAYGRFARYGLVDHVSVIKKLAAYYPSMDLDRVGAYGFSQAGYFALRSLLDYPELYKAAVSIAGFYHIEGQMPGYLQKWQGPLGPGVLPPEYREIDCRPLAAKMMGKLLMIAGDLDDIAPLPQTLQMSDALIAADKDFDLLIMTGHNHFSLPTNPYVLRRMWNFFLNHLS